MALNARLSRTAFFSLELLAFTLMAERWHRTSWRSAMKSTFISAAVFTVGLLGWLTSSIAADVSSAVTVGEYRA
jgi:hypothetical protein